jgi:hypothetical protein
MPMIVKLANKNLSEKPLSTLSYLKIPTHAVAGITTKKKYLIQ